MVRVMDNEEHIGPFNIGNPGALGHQLPPLLPAVLAPAHAVGGPTRNPQLAAPAAGAPPSC